MTDVRNPFRFDVGGTDSTPVLHLHGDADLAAGIALRCCLRGLLEAGATTITLDVSDLGHLCPAAARAIDQVRCDLGDGLAVVGADRTLTSVLAVLGLSSLPLATV